MNGVLNFSVLDGWWYEGYVEGAGWALTDKRTYDNQTYQDELDASTIYSMLENEIIPLYYAHNSNGYSYEWVQYIKKSMAEIAPHFTTKRMMDDYFDRFYNKLSDRSKQLRANNYKKAKRSPIGKKRQLQNGTPWKLLSSNSTPTSRWRSTMATATCMAVWWSIKGFVLWYCRGVRGGWSWQHE